MNEFLKKAMKEANSFESREKQGAAGLEIKPVGTIEKEKRFYDIYLDSGGNLWYKTRVKTKQGALSEYEAVFGRKEPRKARRYL